MTGLVQGIAAAGPEVGGLLATAALVALLTVLDAARERVR